jgi:hypothetical protein
MTLSNGEIALMFATFMLVAGVTWTIMIVRAMRAEADKLRELAWKASQEHSRELLSELRAIRETLGDVPSRTIRETLGDIRDKLYNP